MKYQQWNITEGSQQARRAMERQGVPALVAATLCARGMTDLEQAKRLLADESKLVRDVGQEVGFLFDERHGPGRGTHRPGLA